MTNSEVREAALKIFKNHNLKETGSLAPKTARIAVSQYITDDLALKNEQEKEELVASMFDIIEAEGGKVNLN